jgi:apolipoprotein N-acyltransferase
VDKIKRKKIKLFFLIFLSSILSILAFPPFNFWLCAFIFLVPLLFAIERTSSRKNAFWVGYIAGFIHYLGLIFWLRHVVWFGLFFVVAVVALYPAFFALFSKILVFEKSGEKPHEEKHHFIPVSILAALWVISEFLRGELPYVNFGWGLMAYSQSSNLYFIQIADCIGAYGVSCAVIVINGLIFFGMKSVVFSRKKALLCAFDLLSILLILYGYGALKLSLPIVGRDCRVGVVQGNIAQEIKWHPLFKEHIIKTYIKLIEFISYDKPDLIVLPEAAYPGNFLAEFPESPINEEIKNHEVPVLIGGIGLPDYEHEYNSAFLVSGNGKILDSYHKTVLVPFGEYIPFKWFFSLFGLTKLAYSLGVSDFNHGEKYTLFSLPHNSSDIKFSTLICFEDLFPRLSRHFVMRGAEFLVVITNDAWYKKTAAAHQHFQASIFRALENNRYVVRSANTGVSGFISPRGEVLNTVKDKDGNEIFVIGGVSRPLKVSTKRTLYTRYGFIFPYVCVLFIGVVFYGQDRKKNRSKGTSHAPNPPEPIN